MNNALPTEQSLYQITSIKLSKDGEKAVRGAFPVQALQYADEKYGEIESNDSPFYTYKTLCITYCRSNGKSVDWKSLNSVPERNMLETNQRNFTNSSYSTNRTWSSKTAAQGGQDSQKGGRSSFFTREMSPEYLEKLRRSEERYPTALKVWQTKIPHESLSTPYERPSLSYNQAMEQITLVEEHATQPQSFTLMKILGKQLFDANIKAQCERTLELVDYDLKEG